jgi:transposase, IS5 family
MNEIMPWIEKAEAIRPYYPKELKDAGRKPIELERMQRIHFLHHWFELSGPAV